MMFSFDYHVDSDVTATVKIKDYKRITNERLVPFPYRSIEMTISFRNLYFDGMIPAHSFIYFNTEHMAAREDETLNEFNKYWDLINNIDYIVIHHSEEHGKIRIKDIKDENLKSEIIKALESEVADIMI